MGFATDAGRVLGLRGSLHERSGDPMHMTFAQAVAWIATFGGAWVMVRAGAAKGMLKVKAPARCASCGRTKAWGRCPCTDE
jgi:hypothetical protein